MVEGKRVLLTGGGGFIGTTLARRLLDGNEVVVYDNGHRSSMRESGLLGHPRLTVLQGDVLDVRGLREAIRGAQIVVQLAAIAGVDTVLKMPVTTMKVNLIGTFNVLEAAAEEVAIERLVDVSTSDVFGVYAEKISEGDDTDLGTIGEARWTSAVSKLATEHMAHNYHVQYGLPAVSIRPVGVYGPAQVGDTAIHRFVVNALKGEDLEIHNDGGQVRAWCFVDDVVDALLLCLDEPGAVGHTFNIGNPRSVCTVHDLALRVVRLAGSPSKLTFVPRPAADVELRVPTIDKARQILGFEPRVDLDEGLLRTIAWYRERGL